MRNRSGIWLLCWLPFWVAGLALAGDAEAPLTVEASFMEADRAREISVFKGAVRIDKGGIHIEADEARLRAQAGAVQEGTLIGDPVKFRQQPEDAPLIEGEAQRIEYDAVNRIVVLTGDAWVRQGGDEFRGETIRYDLDNRKVLATSDQSEPERVRIIFQPQEEQPESKAANNGGA